MNRVALIGVLLVTLLIPPLGVKSASASRYKLGTVQAADLMRTALLRHPNISFQAGYSRRVECNKRASDIHLKCRMSWIVGDSLYWGKGTIWLTFPEHRPLWNYSYRMTRLNEYCAIVEERDHCTRVFVVR